MADREFKTKTARELMAQSYQDCLIADDPDNEQRIRERKWGNWTYHPENLTLEHACGREIDLETCSTSAQMLDWIFQIFHSRYMSREDVYFLLLAFDHLLQPQSCLCSYGGDCRIDVKHWISKLY